MTSALRLPKTFDEVTQATLLEEDWYDMRLHKYPEILPNGALKEWMKENDVSITETDPEAKANRLYEVAADASGYQNENGQFAGLNWVLSLKVEHEDPMIRGRSFKKYLGIPNKGDDLRVTPLGQSVEDSKMEEIQEYLEAFKGSEIDGSSDTVELTPGDMAQFYIEKKYNDRFEREENTLSMNQRPIPMG